MLNQLIYRFNPMGGGGVRMFWVIIQRGSSWLNKFSTEGPLSWASFGHLLAYLVLFRNSTLTKNIQDLTVSILLIALKSGLIYLVKLL